MLSVKRLVLPVLALASISVASVARAPEPPLTAGEQSVYVEKLRAEDARLAKAVTVGETQIYLGDLLKKISEQSGVTLTVSDKGRAADTQVTVFAKDMPVGAVMDRLWSLLSYQGALWYWEKQDGSPNLPCHLCRRCQTHVPVGALACGPRVPRPHGSAAAGKA